MERRERRIVDTDVEVRSNDDGTVGVAGYAVVYNSPAHGEVIRSSAFTRSLAQRDNIRFLVNHEGVPLASTRAGTMTVESREKGLWFDIPNLDVQNNSRAAEFVSAVRRRDLHQCSFAMTATDDPTVDGLREIREAKLWELSGVTFPWYEDTTVGMREALDHALVAIRSAPRDDLAAFRDDLLAALTRELGEPEPTEVAPDPEPEPEPVDDEDRETSETSAVATMSPAQARALLGV